MDPIAFEARRFRSTAAYYARYRVPYPPKLLASVAERVGLKPGDGVLDLGCGPAMLGIGFASLGARVTAMDPEPEMLAAAGEAAREAGVALNLVQGSSYDLGPQTGRFKLVTMGRSFHWMDRPATLAALDGLIEPGGAVGLFHDRKIFSQPDWRSLIEPLSEKYAPDRRESREQRRSPGWQPHEVMLLGSAFSAVESRGMVFMQLLTSDDIVGRAYSMSVTSPEALGAHQTAFEVELRTALATLSPDYSFRETVAADALLGFRPTDLH